MSQYYGGGSSIVSVTGRNNSMTMHPRRPNSVNGTYPSAKEYVVTRQQLNLAKKSVDTVEHKIASQLRMDK